MERAQKPRMIRAMVEALEEDDGVEALRGSFRPHEVGVDRSDRKVHLRRASPDQVRETFLDVDCCHLVSGLRESERHVAPSRAELDDASGRADMKTPDKRADRQILAANDFGRAGAVGKWLVELGDIVRVCLVLQPIRLARDAS